MFPQCVHLGEVFILHCITHTELLGAAFGKVTHEIQTQITPPGLLTSLGFLLLFSRAGSNGRMLGGLGCFWSLGGSWGGELCRVSLWAVCWDFAQPGQSSLPDSGAPSAPSTVLWDLWLSQASPSVQMTHKQKGKAAAGQGHQGGLLVESEFVQPWC